MPRVSFYKPNSKNTGAAFSANFKGSELYFNIVKQASWNDSSRRASFKENVKNPQKSLAVKINTTEAANIILAMETKGKYSTYHKSKNQNLNINFELMMDKQTDTEKGFSLRILKEDVANSVDKISFSMGFYFAEGLILKAFLNEFIVSSFFVENTDPEQEPQSGNEDRPQQAQAPKESKKPESQNDDW